MPAVRPVKAIVSDEVMLVVDVEIAAFAVDAARVVAPETATPTKAFDATESAIVAEIVTRAVVPVESVTDGLVPGDPDRDAVNVVDVVVPVLVV